MQTTINLNLYQKLLVIPQIELSFKGRSLLVTNAIIDTGSNGSLFDADLVSAIDVLAMTGKDRRIIEGIGGQEDVFEHEITITIGNASLENFTVEVGNMQRYGVEALIGLDYLLASKALINLETLTLTINTL
jgi:hypothetical protein